MTRSIYNGIKGHGMSWVAPASLTHIRSLSGPSGIDKHLAPYPTLPKISSQGFNPSPQSPVPPPTYQGGSEIFRDLTIRALGATERTPSERWESVYDGALRDGKEPGNVYTGRSVPVSDGDVSAAYRRLHMILSRNRVRSELFLQRRFEKPSDRERRLKSERHRRRFAAWIRKKVQLVSEIRRRG